MYQGLICHPALHQIEFKITGSMIYGLSWDKTQFGAKIRTDNSVGMVANAGYDSYIPVNDFNHAQIYKSIHEVTDEYGNVFIRIPKFWIGKTDGAGYKTWRISLSPFPGFY
jgi:hypothetical protein